MAPVTVLVLAPAPDAAAGPLERLLDIARDALIDWHRAGFLAAGASDVVVRREPPDDTPFGTRLRRIVGELRPGGLVVLGAGAIPLATALDRRALVDAAARDVPYALVNQRYSADVTALAQAWPTLRHVPDLDTDNVLPRWLAEIAGVPVADLARRRRLAMDVDTPLDVVLLEGTAVASVLPSLDARVAGVAGASLDALRRLAANPGAELLVAGRTSAADLGWQERRTRSRSRALVEERGLRTAAAGALVGRPNRRPPRSLLGELLDCDGPDQLGRLVAGLADGALIDSRVLIAHRFGPDTSAWPPAGDRFASDLLLPDRVADPWLRALTRAAADASVPIQLGGHSLVGPGLRLALRAR